MSNSINVPKTVEMEFSYPCSIEQMKSAFENPLQYTSTRIKLVPDSQVAILPDLLTKLTNLQILRIQITPLYSDFINNLLIFIKSIPQQAQCEWNIQGIVSESVFNLIRSTRVVKLTMHSNIVSEISVKTYISELESLTELKKLSINLLSTEFENFKRNSSPTLEFMRVFSLQKFHSLENLELIFDRIEVISSKELSLLGQLLSESSKKLKSISLDFKSTILESKGCESLFQFLANKSNYILNHFSFKSQASLSDSIIKQIGSFLNSANKIEIIEFSNISVTLKALKNLLNYQSKLPKLTSITLRLDNPQIQIKDGGLTPISEFLNTTYSSLNTVKLELNSKSYSDESFLQLNSALKRIENIKILFLKFSGIILNQFSAEQLGESITRCKQLQHLKVDFSIVGNPAVVEWKSDSDDSTIFETKQAKIVSKQCYITGILPIGYYSTYFIDLAVAQANQHFTHLEIDFPAFSDARQPLIDHIRETFQQLSENSKNLKQIFVNTKNANDHDKDMIKKMIKYNISTLSCLKFQGDDISRELVETFEQLPKNSISSISLILTKDEEVQFDYIQLFPNLVSFKFQYLDRFPNPNRTLSGRDIVNSNLTYFYHCEEQNTNESRAYKECMRTKISLIHSLSLFEKLISPLLLFHPNQIISDLWIGV